MADYLPGSYFDEAVVNQRYVLLTEHERHFVDHLIQRRGFSKKDALDELVRFHMDEADMGATIRGGGA